MFGMFGHGFGPQTFEAHYRAMPVAFIDKPSAEFGDKVILPPSALDRLASLQIEYPMLFKIESPSSGRSTHCGVLEFVAEEGVVYMPHWMMQNLLLQVGDMVKFKNVSLPKGKFVKLQPVTSDFLDISNPKAVLERTLRSYTCLTVGDCFVVNYNNKNYEIEVRETKPGNAISVVETDCQVDFEAPKDYKEPEKVFKPSTVNGSTSAILAGTSKVSSDSAAAMGSSQAAASASETAQEAAEAAFLAFAGTSRRLDGKPITNPGQPVPVPLGRLAGSAGLTPAVSSTATTLTSKPADTTASGKTGTFVSTGNRLMDKLLKEKGQNPSSLPTPPPAPETTEEEKPSSSFQAFSGKGRTLK
ncbi:hypothetical protein CEUSTIGMA_g11626.t1 [Chlamydomonas eustigma]|uniref:Uncharacterized protein n=1 Tax=Chlamydomonas eustigma TaxID=1157962 RepID=A0A250XMF0_9CHLO|nr:hypothetical protein CEUSTIGMA_g11626.t1 [Chlamydomonas eustigma]|eukprot:GAX84203.1 hypothetical protein CEUSTIGMA_g11626.t1 [Chlamydomonas eustigma]